MALNKVTYVDGQTIIGAQNLNNIQDEIIANGNAIGTQATAIQNLDTNKADVTPLNAEASARAEADTAIDGELDELKSAITGTSDRINVLGLDINYGYSLYENLEEKPSSSTIKNRVGM